MNKEYNLLFSVLSETYDNGNDLPNSKGLDTMKYIVLLQILFPKLLKEITMSQLDNGEKKKQLEKLCILCCYPENFYGVVNTFYENKDNNTNFGKKLYESFQKTPNTKTLAELDLCDILSLGCYFENKEHNLSNILLKIYYLNFKTQLSQFYGDHLLC